MTPHLLSAHRRPDGAEVRRYRVDGEEIEAVALGSYLRVTRVEEGEPELAWCCDLAAADESTRYL